MTPLSLSLWFLCLWHAYAYSGLLAGISATDEAKMEDNEQSRADQSRPMEVGSVYSRDGICTIGPETRVFGDDLLATDGNNNDILDVEVKHDVVNSGVDSKSENEASKSDRRSRAVPLDLDELKRRAFSSKGKSETGQTGSVIHRVDADGTDYNYASASKGAKVLSFNKESKGASYILGRDKDKYLRNPCSAEEKFIVIELSEETLVDTIEIANFEHYSSNVKDFELLGSMVYPTDAWIKLGNFTAASVKVAQRFALREPKWVRYLQLNLLSHYGSEFYCTLSVVEIYGVDAVERMLENLISVPDNLFASEEGTDEQKSMSSQPEAIEGNDIHQNIVKEIDSKSSVENNDSRHHALIDDVPDPVEELRHQQIGRMAGDTVLKILMQKVRSLELNLSVLERYLEGLNSRYGNILTEFDKDIRQKALLVQTIRSDITNLLESQEIMAKDVGELTFWKSLVSMQLDSMIRDNAIVSSQVEKVGESQISMENKGITVFFVCLIFGFFALVRVFIDIVLSLYVAFSFHRTDKSWKFCWLSFSWLYLLVCCSIIIFILSV